MTLTDLVIILLLVFILGAAITYMKKEKKRGVTCIGCPDAPNCAKRFTEEGCKDDYKY